MTTTKLQEALRLIEEQYEMATDENDAWTGGVLSKKEAKRYRVLIDTLKSMTPRATPQSKEGRRVDMIDRIRLAYKVLFIPQISVVTKGEQFCTFNNAVTFSDSKRIYIEVKL